MTENKAKQKAERMLFIVVIISIFLLAMILIWVLRIQSIRNKQRKQITELELEKSKNQKLILEQQLKEHETLTLLEQERFNTEIDAKNRQLTAQVLLQANRKEMIQEIIQILSIVPQQSKVSELDSVMFSLKQQLKEAERWNDFFIHFEQINPSFISLLKEKHPDINDNDIRLLSYIYLNLDSKKIAELLNISFDSFRKKKQRLANKMGIETTELYTHLVNSIN